MKLLPSQKARKLAKRWYRYTPWHEVHYKIVKELTNFTILIEFVSALKELNYKGGFNHELDELAIILNETFKDYDEKRERKDPNQA